MHVMRKHRDAALRTTFDTAQSNRHGIAAERPFVKKKKYEQGSSRSFTRYVILEVLNWTHILSKMEEGINETSTKSVLEHDS